MSKLNWTDCTFTFMRDGREHTHRLWQTAEIVNVLCVQRWCSEDDLKATVPLMDGLRYALNETDIDLSGIEA